MSYLDDLKKKQVPTPPKIEEAVGLIWMNILVEYNFKTGKSKIVRSFSKPAKDSTIKQMFKKKPIKETIKVENEIKEEKLF